jgi:hypothetical protein
MKNELQKDILLRRLRQERLIELSDGTFHKMTLADLKKILQESYSIKVTIGYLSLIERGLKPSPKSPIVNAFSDLYKTPREELFPYIRNKKIIKQY